MFTSKLEDLRALLAANLSERSVKEARIDEIVAAVEVRSDKNPTAEESAEVDAVRSAVAVLDEARTSLTDEITKAESRAAARTEAEVAARALPTPLVTTTGNIVGVRAEARTYRPDGEHSFFTDLYCRQERMGDTAGAEQRLARHMQESLEGRASSVSTMAGMVPPQYLVDQYAPFASSGRPFLNSLNSLPLPDMGTSFVIPRVSTGATATVLTEGATFNDTDIAVSNDTATVQLIGAKSDVSRTLFERGGATTDMLIFPELLEACNRNEDSISLNGTSATTSFLGVVSVSGINSVAYTDASPTVAELWPKLADAIQRINSNRYAPPTAIFMHPRRWGWITSAIDSQNRPLFNFTTTPPTAPVFGLGTALQYGQIVGTLQGLPVITDASIATTWASGAPGAGTEDYIVVVRTPDLVLWEDNAMRFTFEQAPTTAPGQVRLAVGRFALFHAARFPKSISVIGGTGMTAPSF